MGDRKSKFYIIIEQVVNANIADWHINKGMI